MRSKLRLVRAPIGKAAWAAALLLIAVTGARYLALRPTMYLPTLFFPIKGAGGVGSQALAPRVLAVLDFTDGSFVAHLETQSGRKGGLLSGLAPYCKAAQSQGVYGFAFRIEWPAARQTTRTLLRHLQSGAFTAPFCLWTAPNSTLGRDGDGKLGNSLTQLVRLPNFVRHGRKGVLFVGGAPDASGWLTNNEDAADTVHPVWNGASAPDETNMKWGAFLPDCGDALNGIRGEAILSRTGRQGARQGQVPFTRLCVPKYEAGQALTPLLLSLHPKLWRFGLTRAFAAGSPSDFLIIDAWSNFVSWDVNGFDMWKEGVPSLKGGVPVDVDRNEIVLPAAGVTSTRTEDARVCIVVRTFTGHTNGFYTLHRMLSSLQSLQHKTWKAFLSPLDDTPFPALHSIIDAFSDDRMVHVELPAGVLKPYDPSISGYDTTDELIRRYCTVPEYDWMLVTNGDNWYAPDALNYLPPSYDMVLMNFYSRAHAFVFAKDQPCCARLETFDCMQAAPRVWSVDLGGILLSLPKYKGIDTNFVSVIGDRGPWCGACHDGAMAEHLVAAGWRWTAHDKSVCAFHHNGNALSCSMAGGVWYDRPDKAEGCYPVDEASALDQQTSVETYVSSRFPCLC